MPLPPRRSTSDTLALTLSRWRRVLLASVIGILVLLIAGFSFERAMSRLTEESTKVLRIASEAQRALAAAQLAAQRSQTGVAEHSTGAIRAHRDRFANRVDSLRTLSAGEATPTLRLDSLVRAFGPYDAEFLSPIADAGRVPDSVVQRGLLAHDRASRHLEIFVGEEAAVEERRLALRRLTLWTAFTLLLLAVASAGTAAVRVTTSLSEQAALAAEQQHRLEDQAAELQQQAAVQEKQAAQLEEQATSLRERVAERDETNRLLRQASVLLDSALESSPLGIAFFDRSGRYQRVNAALAAINGVSADEHLGRRLEDIVPDLAPKARPVIERVLATGQAETGVIIQGATAANDRTMRRFNATFYPIARPGEAPVGVGVMVLDTTEQHRLEQQLRQSQKLEAVGRLAGGVAHDFNNVLTVIQSYAEMLAMDAEPDAPIGEELTAIRAAADRASALARQLLAFSRRDVIIPREVDVNAVIRGMDLILRRLLRQGIELRVLVSEAALIVRMDAGQLEQVVMNLAINAVDAMPRGGELRIVTEEAAMPDGRGAVRVRVEDDGEGITADVQERLFEPFFTTKPAGLGTGLGLATSYAIVREAGGNITVHSAAGEGACFEVLLPRSSAGAADAARRLSPADGIPTAREGERVLLAEDEPSIRGALSRILRGAGYDVIEAGDGGEALRLAAADPREISVLLTDVMMPGVGGKELVERLLDTRPDLRVIMMSGYTDDADLRAALGSARFTFLQKPFAARAILGAVRDAIDAR